MPQKRPVPLWILGYSLVLLSSNYFLMANMDTDKLSGSNIGNLAPKVNKENDVQYAVCPPLGGNCASPCEKIPILYLHSWSFSPVVLLVAPYSLQDQYCLPVSDFRHSRIAVVAISMGPCKRT